MSDSYTIVKTERLSSEHLNSVRRLRQSESDESWPERLSDQFLRWRYSAREESETLLAFDGDHCVAMLDSVFHSYRIGNAISRVREPCEWFCLPQYRPKGLGLRLMRTFMKEPEPMFAMGGTRMTQDILPLLGWQSLPPTTNFSLPLTSGALADSLLGKLHFPTGRLRTRVAHSISVPLWYRRQRNLAGHGAITQLQTGEPVPHVEPSTEYALACISSQWEPDWLNEAPHDMGDFHWLVGRVDGEPVGLTISRLFRRNGTYEANLLHLQASQRSADIYTWLITETSRFLAKRGAVKIACRAACPDFSSALKRVGFVERSSTPAFWWSKDGPKLSGPLHLTLWRGDEAIRPYPT